MNPILAQFTYDQLLDRLKHDLATASNASATNAMATSSLFPEAWGPWPHDILICLGIVFASVFLASCFFTVSTQHVAIIERFKKYARSGSAGLRFKLPFIDRVVDHISLMLEQHSIQLVTITKEKVTVNVFATIQYKVIPGREYDAYYLLDDPAEQIEKFFRDIMRAQVPVLTLDELYETKDAVSISATQELEKDMTPFGYNVPRVLITSIVPDEKVQAAMNDINAAQREAQAAAARGDAVKIQRVKEAEAQAESDRLRGIGIANQRTEIAKGFHNSITEMKAGANGASDSEILSALLMVQYFETMTKLSSGAHSNVIMVPHSPAGMDDIRNQISQALLVAKPPTQ